MLYTPSKHARSSWIHVGSMKIMNSETPPVEVSPDVETSNGYLRGNSSNATILPFPLARGNGRIPWNPGSIMSLCDECRPWVVPVAPKRVRNRWNTSSPENYVFVIMVHGKNKNEPLPGNKSCLGDIIFRCLPCFTTELDLLEEDKTSGTYNLCPR